MFLLDFFKRDTHKSKKMDLIDKKEFVYIYFAMVKQFGNSTILQHMRVVNTSTLRV